MSEISADRDGIVSFEDAAEIGFKVVEMADRVLVGHKVFPGSQAKWSFEMDDNRFVVIVTVDTESPP